jgi:release factor glutamine methyltransferase
MKTVLKTAVHELDKAHIQNPEFEAELLLAHVLNIPQAALLCYDHDIDNTMKSKFFNLIAKRKKHYPIQYLLGEWEFWSLSLSVAEGVFIPRPETETLIELALHHKDIPFSLIIDLGTGSGNIALAMAKEFEHVPVIAIDISSLALQTARYNARSHGMQERISFLQSDFLSGLNASTRDTPVLFVSNPPYIGLHELNTLQDEVALYEPITGYLADNGGLECYIRIFKQLAEWHSSPNYLLLEIAPQLAPHILKIAKQYHFTLTDQRNDVNQHLRALLFSQ